MFKPSLLLVMMTALIGPAVARADVSAPPPPVAAAAVPVAAAPPATLLSRMPEYSKGIWFQNQELTDDRLASLLEAWKDSAETQPWDDMAGIRNWTEAIEEVLADFAARQMPLGHASNFLTVDENNFAHWDGATGEARTQSPGRNDIPHVGRDPSWNPTLLFEFMARSDLDHLGGVIDDPSLATWIFRLNFSGDSLPPSLLADISELSETP